MNKGITPNLEGVIEYLESFIEFCDCGNPKLDCICLDKNGYETTYQSRLEQQNKILIDEINWIIEELGYHPAVKAMVKNLEKVKEITNK